MFHIFQAGDIYSERDLVIPLWIVLEKKFMFRLLRIGCY